VEVPPANRHDYTIEDYDDDQNDNSGHADFPEPFGAVECPCPLNDFNPTEAEEKLKPQGQGLEVETVPRKDDHGDKSSQCGNIDTLGDNSQ